MPERTVEDRLREEYFDILPDIRRVAWQLETEIMHITLPLKQSLAHYEQLVVKSRVKECESAIKTLRGQQEGNVFDPEKREKYSILDLKDLAGSRVLVFPRNGLIKTVQMLRQYEPFRDWVAEPLSYAGDERGIPMYFGFFPAISSTVCAEFQVVPMLIGLFWEVEHSAMYKPIGWAKGIENDEGMNSCRTEVEISLARFEAEFEKFVEKNSQPPSE